MENRLKKLRMEKKLTQTQMSEILHISQTGYSKYETGENDIPTQMLIKIAKYFGISVDYLLGLTDEKRPCRKKCPYKG